MHFIPGPALGPGQFKKRRLLEEFKGGHSLCNAELTGAIGNDNGSGCRGTEPEGLPKESDKGNQIGEGYDPSFPANQTFRGNLIVADGAFFLYQSISR